MIFRSPVTRPLHRSEWTRPAGSLDFRVTQQFDDVDYYWRDRDIAAGRTPRTHMATDIGNTRCGDAIVAMAPGIATRVQDNATALGAASNALGMVVDHGSGVTSEYWHLNGWSVATGARVTAGQQIGIVGSTGLLAVCHCHIEVKVNGTRIDPEPLMFGGSLTLQEDDVQIKGKFLRHVENREGRLTDVTNFRVGVLAGDDAVIAELPAGSLFKPVVVVEGRAAGTAPDRLEWYGGIKSEGVAGAVFGYVHSSLLPRTADGKSVALQSAESVDCTDQIAEATAPLNERIARMKGKTKAFATDIADD